MKAKTGLRLLQWVLILIGIVALGYYAAVWIEARNFQARAAREFNQQVRRRGAAATPQVPLTPAVPEDGELIGRLRIPRLDLSVMVVQGDSEGDLKRAAGHIPGTALPGRPGNVGIAGHRDTFFRPLRLIRQDDTIHLTYLGGDWRYKVVSTKVVSPKDVEVLCPTKKDTLTLVTCYPFYYIGSAPQRFIVKAQRVMTERTRSATP